MLDKVDLSLEPEEFDKKLKELQEKSREERKYLPLIEHAWIEDGEVNLYLSNHIKISFPPYLCQEISNISPEELEEVKVSPGGYAVYWEESGAGITLNSILAGRFGSRKWMEEISVKYNIPLGDWREANGK